MGLKKVWISSLLLCPVLLLADTLPVCGGDGPQPLPVKTHGLEEKIGTVGTAQDFVVWENSNQIIYRNEKNDLYVTGLTGGTGGRKFATSPGPLTHFPDPQEEYLTTSLGAWFLDVNGGHWIQYTKTVPEMEPIFWNGDDMYALPATTDLMGSVMKIYKYHANSDYVEVHCDSNTNLNFNVANGWHLAQGHSYPWIYLYQEIPLSQGTVVNLYRVQADRCQVEQLQPFKLVTQGRIQSIYRFEKQDAIAIKLDTPTRNLLWKQGSQGCQYFDIGPDSQPILLNRQLPVMAAWSAYSPGVTLYDFRNVTKQVQMTTVLDEPAAPILNLGSEDLYLSDDGQQLFVRPGVGREASSSLMRVRFKGFLSDGP